MSRDFKTATLCLLLAVFFCINTAGCTFGKKTEPVKTSDTALTERPTETPTPKVEALPLKTEADKFEKPQFRKESTRNIVDVPFTPTKYKTLVSSYKVSEDLSNIENLNQFGSLTDEQIKALVQNSFIVTSTKEQQLFYIYENNEYLKIPSFITTDSVLQMYHIFYDYALRTLEYDALIKEIENLTESMLKKSVDIYSKIGNPTVKAAALKNISYFAVAQMSLKKPIPQSVPSEALELAKKEYSIIEGEAGFERSAIFPFKLDYSQFKPRGHYTRNEDFKRYFRAMMWYGQAPFPFYITKGNEKVRDTEQTIQALLITCTLFMNGNGRIDIDAWEKIYDPTVFYVGKSDDLNVYDYTNLLTKVYGMEPAIEKLDDRESLDKLYNEVEMLPEPKIKAKYTDVDTPTGKQFRFMGQRYIPDSEILQELVEPLERPCPSGLDVMGVLGSGRAKDILINTYHEDEKWDKYVETFNKLEQKFSLIDEETWRSNMYYGWLWVLKPFTKDFNEGYPSFMTNTAWQDKSLSTALGSWSELRHDTILYGKQSGAECGGGDEPPQVKGYVEPNIEVYERLLWLTEYSRKNLKAKGILSNLLEDRMNSFESLLKFLINCSVKELKGEELSKEEYYELLTYGGMLEYLTTSFAEEGINWYEITSETDKNMAVVADIHTIAPNEYSDGGYLEVGVGPAHEIFVVVPIGGKLYLTRGAVFSYYEFESKTRLTDEEWQKRIKENKQPKRPEWTNTFIKGNMEKAPVPAEPYSSGC